MPPVRPRSDSRPSPPGDASPGGNTPAVITRVDALWVLSKPAGFAVHPTGEGVPDLLSFAVAHLAVPPGISPIHRLDRETSGVVLCSADQDTLAHYGQLFARGQVTKRYRALVHGRTHVKGVIRRPLEKAGSRGMQQAVTRYRRLAWYGPTTYLEVRPETGRRHQVRRHLQGIGHAVVGDERYPPSRFHPVAGFPGRLWLHAESVELPGKVRYRAPLPSVLEQHLELLASMQDSPAQD